MGSFQVVGTTLHYGALLMGALWWVQSVRLSGLAAAAAAYSAPAALVGGLMGGAMLNAVLAGDPAAATRGMVSWGVYAGAGLGAAAGLKLQRQSVTRYFDAGVASFGLSVAMARIGCFIAGCCYGEVTSAGTGMTFPRGTIVYEDHVARALIAPGSSYSLAVHPLQLYLAGIGLSLFLLGTAGQRQSWCAARPGLLAALAALVYGVARLGLENFRDDPFGTWAPISPAQVGSAIAIGLGLAILLVVRSGDFRRCLRAS